MSKITHEDLIEKGIFDEAIKGAQALRAEYQKLYKELQKQITVKIDTQSAAPSNTKFGQDIIKQTSKDLKDLQKLYDDYNKKLEVVAQMQEQLTIAQKKYAETSAETRKEILAAAQAMKDKNEADKLDIKVMSTQEGSLARLRAELSKQKSVLVNDLKIGTDAYNKQQKAVADLTAQVKKEEEAIGVHGRSVGQYGKVVEGLQKVFLGAAAGVAAMAGAVEFGKAVMESTGQTADDLHKAVGGIKEGWNALLTTIATGDFSNLLDNMKEAIAAGEKYIETLDQIRDATRAVSVKQSEYRVEIEKLKTIQKDPSNSKDTRIEAGLKALDLEKKMLVENMALAQKKYEAEMEHAKSRTGLGESTIKAYVKAQDEADPNHAKYEAGKKYLEVLNQIKLSENAANSSQGYAGASSQHQQVISGYYEELKKLGPEARATATVIEKINKLTREGDGSEIAKLTSAWSGMNDVISQNEKDIRKIVITNGKLKKGIIDDGIKEDDKANKEQIKNDEEYYKIKRDLGAMTTDQIIKEEEGKLKKSGTWQRLTLEEKNQWEAQTRAELLSKQSAEEAKKYEAAAAEQQKIDKGVQQLRIELNIATQDEILKYEIERITKTAEFQALSDKDRAAAMAKVYQDALKKSASGKVNPDNEVEGDNSPTPAESAAIPDLHMGMGWLGDFQAWYKDNMKIIQQFAHEAQQALSQIGRAYQIQEQNQLKHSRDTYDTEYRLLDQQLKSKTISQAEYNNKKTALQDKQKAEELKIQKEAAKKQQTIAATQAIINTALAVTNALGTVEPFWLALVMAGLAVGLGAYEVATIEGEQFEEGGYGFIDKSKGGKLKGKRHSQGGISIPGVGTAEDGEYFAVINRGATSKYGDTLGMVFDALNQQRFEQLFQRSAASVNVNVSDYYQRKIYEELSKPKADATTQILGNKKLVSLGNHTVITSV